jgi:hypothetical protein
MNWITQTCIVIVIICGLVGWIAYAEDQNNKGNSTANKPITNSNPKDTPSSKPTEQTTATAKVTVTTEDLTLSTGMTPEQQAAYNAAQARTAAKENSKTDTSDGTTLTLSTDSNPEQTATPEQTVIDLPSEKVTQPVSVQPISNPSTNMPQGSLIFNAPVTFLNVTVPSNGCLQVKQFADMEVCIVVRQKK